MSSLKESELVEVFVNAVRKALSDPDFLALRLGGDETVEHFVLKGSALWARVIPNKFLFWIVSYNVQVSLTDVSGTKHELAIPGIRDKKAKDVIRIVLDLAQKRGIEHAKLEKERAIQALQDYSK